MPQMHKFLWVFVLFLGIAEVAVARKQGKEYVDSLLQVLPGVKEDTNKVNILYDISYELAYQKPAEAGKYAQQCLELSNRLNWKEGMIKANNTIAMTRVAMSDFPGALPYLQVALKLSEESGSQLGVAVISSGMAVVYSNQSDYVKALECNFRALKIYKAIGNKDQIAAVKGNIGILYMEQGNYPQAQQYMFEALKLQEETGNKTGIAVMAQSIGTVYSRKADFGNALIYFNRALAIHNELGNRYGVASVNLNIGVVYSNNHDPFGSLAYFFRALNIFEEIGDKQGTAICLANIGEAYVSEKNYRAAISYINEAASIHTAIGDRLQLANSLIMLGNAYTTLAENGSSEGDNITKPTEVPKARNIPYMDIPGSRSERMRLALTYLQQAADTALKIGALDQLMRAYKGLSNVLDLMGDNAGAFDNYKRFTVIKDSIFSLENEKKLLQTALQYDYDKKHVVDSLQVAAREKELKRQKGYTALGVVAVLLLIGFLVNIMRYNKKLAVEKERSEELLLNILPVEVANELKQTGAAAARHFDNVTILFTDFVNFTGASEKMSPQALIDELHTCFKAFDEITHRHNIEKIKTIGDAYLAVCGLPKPDPDHALNVVKAAIEINDYMQDRLAKIGSDRTFLIRIGIHTGSVVAGIVGVKKFAYDVWGDTVNTAARMEQNSEPGKINISDATYNMVKEKVYCEFRGALEVKNKGEMKMYFVKKYG